MDIRAKKLLHSIAQKIGLDFMRYTPANFATLRRAILLRDQAVDVVLDVGANVGGYAADLRAQRYAGTIISIEPLAQAYEELDARADGDGAWIRKRSAVGRRHGRISMNVSGHLSSSSLLPMTALHTSVERGSGYIATEEVTIAPLDEIVASDISSASVIYLKADVQGYEKEVLESAGRLWPQIVAIEIELSCITLYEGTPSMVEMLTYLDQRGFYPVSMEPAMADSRSGFVLQLNGIFVRKQAGTSATVDAVQAT